MFVPACTGFGDATFVTVKFGLGGAPALGGKGKEEDGVVVFDSEDEDECEDLFAGIWGAEVVAKRRSRRVVARRKEG